MAYVNFTTFVCLLLLVHQVVVGDRFKRQERREIANQRQSNQTNEKFYPTNPNALPDAPVYGRPPPNNETIRPDYGYQTNPPSNNETIGPNYGYQTNPPPKPSVDVSGSPNVDRRVGPTLDQENSITKVCGENIEFATFVVNGIKTSIGEFPWLVAMFYYIRGDYDYRCAGTLVTNRHVITAAHCFRDKAGIEILSKNVALVLGKTNIDNWITHSEVRGVESFSIHPDYSKSSDADLVVVKMDSNVKFSNTIVPICLWGRSEDLEDIVGQKGMVAGWGRDETGAHHVSEPRKLSMPIVAQDECLRSDERFFRITSRRTFCAGDRNGSIPCTGDSGSGFIMKRNRRWWLRGVVSGGLVKSGTRECDSSHYVVFADVAKFRPWVLGKLDGLL